MRRMVAWIRDLWKKMLVLVDKGAGLLGLKRLMKIYRGFKAKTRHAITGVLFISPWLLGLYLFGLRPFLSSLRMSVAKQAIYIIDPSAQLVNFVVKGWTFDQYVNFFQNQPDHVASALQVLTDIALIVPLVMVFALILALMLNQPLKGKGLFRVIFFIPVILLSGNMLSYFNQYDLLTVPAVSGGSISDVINNYLPDQFSFLITGAFERIVLILWLSGVQTLIFLAGLQKNDRSIYEAAAIDGASMWDSFWKITLPGLHHLMIINIIYTTVIYANLSNNNLIRLIQQLTVDVRFGRAYASALSWILFIIELLIIGVYVLMIRVATKRYR